MDAHAADDGRPLPRARRAATRRAAGAALERVGIPDLGGRQLAALSGGQFQRALLAQALLRRPELLVLDEAAQGLDQPGEARFYRLIEQIRAELGCAVLMVSHDLHVVMAASDRVICLNGHVCCEGTPTVVSAAPEYRALFGFGTQGALALYRHDHDHGHDHATAHDHGTTTAHGHDHAHGAGRMSLLDDFLVRALLAGIGVALAAGPLGCFVVWRRMAYFGDATAHAALLGVTLALATALPVVAGRDGGGAGHGADRRRWRRGGAMPPTRCSASPRTAALAAGLVALSFMTGVRVDLMGYLFGDILAVTRGDLAVIFGGAALVVALLAWRWRSLLLATLNEDLAASAGVDPRRERLILTLALALLVAVALKVVGVLLVTAMLIVPAAAARGFARTPEAMAAGAVAVGALAAVAGLAGSWRFDTPAGPSIVVAAVARARRSSTRWRGAAR